MVDKKVTLQLDEKAAKELYNFICEHLDVINDKPYVEDVMLFVESEIDELWGLDE